LEIYTQFKKVFSTSTSYHKVSNIFMSFYINENILKMGEIAHWMELFSQSEIKSGNPQKICGKSGKNRTKTAKLTASC
jgi:hypothetical protein